VIPSSELLAAFGGAPIGSPYYVQWNGAMPCDTSVVGGYCAPGDGVCATVNMINIPSQPLSSQSGTPTVTDMHAKPCIVLADGSCDNLTGSSSNASNTVTAAADTFNYAWYFLYYRFLYYGWPAPAMIFGEAWSNSSQQCNGYPDYLLTQKTLEGYAGSSGDGTSPSSLYMNDDLSVVFRPWGNVTINTCETPLNIGAPSGPYKQ
jgi:hypothetical protein